MEHTAHGASGRPIRIKAYYGTTDIRPCDGEARIEAAYGETRSVRP